MDGHPEIWGFVGVVVGGLLTGGFDLVRRQWERQTKARELRLAKGEDILLQLEAALEWSATATKAAFDGNIYVPLQIPVFRVAAIVEIYFPSLGNKARAVDQTARDLRAALTDVAASKKQQLPLSNDKRVAFENTSAAFAQVIVSMIAETRQVVRIVADAAAPPSRVRRRE